MFKKQTSSTSPELPRREGEAAPTGSDRLDQIEKRQRELWWLAIVLLFVLSLAVAYLSWDTVRSFSTRHLEALPVGLVVLVVLFVFYFGRTEPLIFFFVVSPVCSTVKPASTSSCGWGMT